MKKFKSLREAVTDHNVPKKDDEKNMSKNDVKFADLHTVETDDHPVATDAQHPKKGKKKFSGVRKAKANEEIEKEDSGDFCMAAAAAKKEGKKKFIFAGKEYPVTIKTKIPIKEEIFLDEALKAGMMKLKDGKSVKVSKEDAATLNSVLEDLNPDNRKRMEEELKKDVKSYKSMLTFAKRTG